MLSKVSIAQPGSQHTQKTLIALWQKNLLNNFYTVFASNKFSRLIKILPLKIKSQFRKRSFKDIPLKKIKHRPDLFITEQKGKIAKESDLIKKVFIPFDKWVASDLKKNTPDIFIGYENSNLESFKTAKNLGAITVLDLAQIHHHSILDIHHKFGFLNENYDPEELNYINQRKNEALELTDYIFTLSTFAKDSLIENGIDSKKIFTVNLGINQHLFFPKNRYNTNDKFRFLFVGTITRRKGLDLLLKAFKNLNLTHAELIIIGPMADGNALLEQYKGLYTYIPFLHHEELCKHYRQADVFVFPSYLDSWAQTVVEAMACGTPAIVTENTGAKDAVRQGGGYVIPAGDLNALQDKIVYCYQNQKEMAALGKQAAKIAKQYTDQNYYRQVQEAIEIIINKNHKRSLS